MNDAFYDEKLADIKEAIDVVFRFQLYRRGKIDEYEDGGKVLGDCIDTLLGVATEYQAIMEENKTLKGMIEELKQKVNEIKEEALKNFVEKKVVENIKNNTNNFNRSKKNGENGTQCLNCKEYDKQQGMCRWGECTWYSRKPMCFDMRYCCKTCTFDIDGKCNYLKEQYKREKNKGITNETQASDFN